MSEEEILDIMKNLTLYDYDFEINSKYVQGHDETATMMGNEAIQGLLDLYNKEKEINADLVKTRIEDLQELNKIQQEDFISKDKIREKINKYLEYDKKVKTYTYDGRENFTLEWYKAKALEELLEEE